MPDRCEGWRALETGHGPNPNLGSDLGSDADPDPDPNSKLTPARIVSVADDHTIRIWSLDSGFDICVVDGHDAEVSCVRVVQDRLLTGSMDGAVRTWDFGCRN